MSNFVLQKRLNPLLLGVIPGLLLWGCSLTGQKVPLGGDYAAKHPPASQYLSPRSEAYYHFLRYRQYLVQNRMNEAVVELEKAAAADAEAPAEGDETTAEA